MTDGITDSRRAPPDAGRQIGMSAEALADGRDVARRTADITSGLRAVTFDFGNTLVPVSADALAQVVEMTAREVAGRLGPFEVGPFVEAWREERDRQFAEDVPAMREVDLEQRMVRVLARLRGMAPPDGGERWDDAGAARLSRIAELRWAVDTYSRSFVAVVPAPPGVEPLLARLAARYRLAIVSNWPLGVTIDRFAERAGWQRHLAAIVVSQRVGAIKPHPAIFHAAEDLLGVPPETILHVGDDWSADVVGAGRLGWRTALLRTRPGDSPLPWGGPAGEGPAPDLEIDSLDELPALLEPTAG